MKKKYYDSFAVMNAITDFMEQVGNIQGADVVEVVRCKDCKHFEQAECPWDELFVINVNDYCSKGERKEDEG